VEREEEGEEGKEVDAMDIEAPQGEKKRRKKKEKADPAVEIKKPNIVVDQLLFLELCIFSGQISIRCSD